MFDKRKNKIKPVKTILFNQSDYILLSTIARMLRSNSIFLKNPAWKGLCYALTKAWYEHLMKDRNLINELGFGLQTDKDLVSKITKLQTDKDLVSKITNWQKRTIGSVIPIELIDAQEAKDAKLPLITRNRTEEGYKKSQRMMDVIEAIFSDLDFSEASQQSCMDSSGFTTYLDKLDRFHRSQYGLHVISITNLKPPFGAHMIGWTFKENNYILFDPNRGEMYFNDFKLFSQFLCDYVQSIFPEWKNKHFTMGDFYSEHDLKEIEEIRLRSSTQPK